MSHVGEPIYLAYAPPEGAWSAWVKPVAFACLTPLLVRATPPAPPAPDPFDATWAPPPATGHALVVDLPGPGAVRAGIALAHRGYRPIPIFNATPGPRPLVEVDGVLAALVAGAPVLADLALPAAAPPAFLLDALRRAPGRRPAPGTYDNRWLAFPQDFPSATLLLARGIRSVAVWTLPASPPATDLAHVLRRWQEAGIELELTAGDAPPAPYRAPRPSAFGSLFYRALALFGRGRSNVGGFGAAVPDSGAAGGGLYA